MSRASPLTLSSRQGSRKKAVEVHRVDGGIVGGRDGRTERWTDERTLRELNIHNPNILAWQDEQDNRPAQALITFPKFGSDLSMYIVMFADESVSIAMIEIHCCLASWHMFSVDAVLPN